MKFIYRFLVTSMLILTIPALYAQLGVDVKTHNHPGMQQRQVSMDIAFNGWIYQAFATDSGALLLISKDNGDTWAELDSIGSRGAFFTPRIVVAGTDTNHLRVYMAISKYIPATNGYNLYVDEFDGLTGAFISNHGIFLSTSASIRDFDIATDAKFPSVSSNPYSIGILYGQGESIDSLFLIVSTDSGNTYGTKRYVASTQAFFRHMSLAYGKSPAFSNGRFFMAWEKLSGNHDVGSIYTSRTYSAITGLPTAPVNIDSLYPETTGQLGYPRLAVSQSNTTDNDSTDLSAVLAVQCTPTGSFISNIYTFQNLKAADGDFWSGAKVTQESEITHMPALCFNSTLNNFGLTYFNQSKSEIPYLTNGIGYGPASNWFFNQTNFVDDTFQLDEPWPALCVNPVTGRTAFSWSSNINSSEQAMFDAEYHSGIPVITSLTPDTVAAGSPSFTLTVNGKNFTGSSIIMWSGLPTATTFVNAGQLTAPVANTFLAWSGVVSVSVITKTTDTSSGGGTSNTAIFHVLTVSDVNDLGDRNTIIAYPNPANQQLNIAYAYTQTGKLDARLYDINGNMVKCISNVANAYGNGTINTDLSSLAPGVYQLIINTDKGNYSNKISVVR